MADVYRPARIYSVAYLRIAIHRVIQESDPYHLYHLTIGFTTLISGIEFYLGALLFAANLGKAKVDPIVKTIFQPQ